MSNIGLSRSSFSIMKIAYIIKLCKNQMLKSLSLVHQSWCADHGRVECERLTLSQAFVWIKPVTFLLSGRKVKLAFL